MISSNQDYACVLENQLYFGNSKPAKNESVLRDLGVKAIVDLINYKPNSKPIEHSSDFILLHKDIIDLPTNNIDWCEELAKFIDDQLAQNNIVYVHCAQGISRSSALILYYLITRKHQTLLEAFQNVSALRNVICPNMGFFKGLSELELKLTNRTTFSPDEYALRCLKTQFPFVPLEVITSIYEESKQKMLQNEESYKRVAEERNIEPIGYQTIDTILDKYDLPEHRERIVPRANCSFHHPFD